MALPLLANGADCGPVNALQTLGKRFEQDRGLQQDLFGPGRASSSRQTFRTQQSAAAGFEQDAARFFSGGSGSSQSHVSPSFSMGSMQHALPAIKPSAAAPAPLTAAAPAWAADFLSQSPVQAGPSLQNRSHSTAIIQPQTYSGHVQPGSQIPTFQPRFASGLATMHVPSLASVQAPIDASHPIWQSSEHLTSVTSATTSQTQNDVESANRTLPDDELARTAGVVLASVSHDTSAKFQQSAFLGLMRQLRDGDVVLEGNEMVARSSTSGWADDFHADANGKGKERAQPAAQPLQMTASNVPASGQGWWNDRVMNPIMQPSTANQDTSAAQAPSIDVTAENENDAYFRQDNAEYAEYWKGMHGAAPRLAQPANAQDAEWANLQKDWDNFEATATGIRALSNYQFQENNPYVLGSSSRTTHQHGMHASGYREMYDNILQMEAAVQRDPTNADLWCALGVRQQENEREQKAIHALQRALDLAPDHQSSRLAIAISLTNEGNRSGAVDALHEWVVRHPRFAAATTRPVADSTMQRSERATSLVACLIEMARSDTSGDIDADMQIAMAVLLNTDEAWEKSGDCFRTALHVRPDDWLLWNRVGATLANSGRSDQALEYYQQALQRNPLYIRARYNMGIALANLKRYGEAAEFFFDALVMQDSDSTRTAHGVEDQQGLTSNALWDSLKASCNRMQRFDLAAMCERHDLEGFRQAFEGGV